MKSSAMKFRFAPIPALQCLRGYSFPENAITQFIEFGIEHLLQSHFLWQLRLALPDLALFYFFAKQITTECRLSPISFHRFLLDFLSASSLSE
jgi:hypothetical protein